MKTYQKFQDNRADAARKLDAPMATTLAGCIRPDLRYLKVTLSVQKSFSPLADRRALAAALEAFTERLSRQAGRRPRQRWLQAVYVLESPERKTAAGREESGTYHRHIHGMIEVPHDTSPFKFILEAKKLWRHSKFYAPCNNEFDHAPQPANWFQYLSKEGSRDPQTNRSTFNELLFESFQPITAEATVSGSSGKAA